MMTAKEILKLYNQQSNSLTTTEKKAQKYLLSITKNEEIKRFVKSLFNNKDVSVISSFNQTLKDLLTSNLVSIQIGDKLTKKDLKNFEVDEFHGVYKYTIFEVTQTYDNGVFDSQLIITTTKDFVIKDIVNAYDDYYIY